MTTSGLEGAVERLHQMADAHGEVYPHCVVLKADLRAILRALDRGDALSCSGVEGGSVGMASAAQTPPSPSPVSEPANRPAGPVNCTHVLRREGKAYPRTCQRCGLGPCPFYNKDGSAL